MHVLCAAGAVTTVPGGIDGPIIGRLSRSLVPYTEAPSDRRQATGALNVAGDRRTVGSRRTVLRWERVARSAENGHSKGATIERRGNGRHWVLQAKDWCMFSVK